MKNDPNNPNGCLVYVPTSGLHGQFFHDRCDQNNEKLTTRELRQRELHPNVSVFPTYPEQQ
jgi:hypothetical protein